MTYGRPTSGRYDRQREMRLQMGAVIRSQLLQLTVIAAEIIL